MTGLESIQLTTPQIRWVCKLVSSWCCEEVPGVILLNIYVRPCGVMPYQQVHPIISVSGVQQKNEHFFSYKTEKMSDMMH